ncbi:hypothetical protein ACC807_14885 [Rhizobium ruizarguesonis]
MERDDDLKAKLSALMASQVRSRVERFRPQPQLPSSMRTATNGNWTVTTIFATEVHVSDLEVRALRNGMATTTINSLFHVRRNSVQD